MATLEKRSGGYRVIFYHEGKRYCRSLKTWHERIANAAVTRLEERIEMVSRGSLEIPEEGDVADFLLLNGRVTKPGSKAKEKDITLRDLMDDFFCRPSGSAAWA